MERKYHACGLRPSGVGRMAMSTATMMGENFRRVFM
jgi:hypothetical protein